MVEHAVGVGNVDVEGVVEVSAAEGGEHDVEPAIGVGPVHGVDNGGVGVYIMRKVGVEVALWNSRYCFWGSVMKGMGYFHDIEG